MCLYVLIVQLGYLILRLYPVHMKEFTVYIVVNYKICI